MRFGIYKIMNELSNKHLGWFFGISTAIVYAAYFSPEDVGDIVTNIAGLAAFISIFAVIFEKGKLEDKLVGVAIILFCLSLIIFANYMKYWRHTRLW